MIDANTARHLLRKVPYDDGFDAAILFPPKTLARKRIRSLGELARMLEPNERMIPSVGFGRLAAWVERSVGDRELARKLEAIAREEGTSYLRRCETMHRAVVVRCRQLAAAAGEGKMRRGSWVLLLIAGTLYRATIRSYETLSAGEKVVAKGVVYYSEPMRFDYDRDGKLDNVVMAAKFFVKKTPGGYRGYLVRGLYDLDRKKAIAHYADSLIMHPHVNTDIAVSDIRVEGKTVTFRSGPFTYTFVDGGPGIANDAVRVRLGDRSKTLRLYGGDVVVYPSPKDSRTTDRVGTISR